MAVTGVVSLVVTGLTYALLTGRISSPGSTLAAAASFTPYRDAVLAEAPLLYWRMDETTGTTTTDTAGGDDAGTVRGTYAWGAAGALASETRSTALGLTSGYVTENTCTTHGNARTLPHRARNPR